MDTFLMVCFSLFHIAVGGSPDYQSVPAMLTFSSSQPQINVSVPIIDDGMNEPDEMFSVNLTRLTDNSRVAIRPDTADVVIIDDDGTYIASVIVYRAQYFISKH